MPSGYLADQLQVPSIPTTFSSPKKCYDLKEVGMRNYNTTKFKKYFRGLAAANVLVGSVVVPEHVGGRSRKPTTNGPASFRPIGAERKGWSAGFTICESGHRVSG